MTMLFNERRDPTTKTRFKNRLADQPIPKAVEQKQYKRLEAQAATTKLACERLDHSESKLKTSATQILLAILRHAALQEDPTD